jgi:hypothetical protein
MVAQQKWRQEMVMMMALLNDIAKALKVHPRTVCRAYTGVRNTYWSEDHNPELEIDKVAMAFGCPPHILRHALEGTDEFLSMKEAAQELGLKPRTFRWRNYTRTIRHGGVARYSRNKLLNENFRDWD